MNELVKKSLWRASLLYAYSFIGGCMFYIIEKKPENNKEASTRLSRELQRNFTREFNISINDSDFDRFMQTAFEIVKVGNKADWGIITGISFTMTSLTTIGYGHITPETPLGQILTVFYCIVGLPLSTLALKSLGEIISKGVYKFVYLVETKVLGRKRPRKVKIKSFFVTVILMIFTLCVGGLVQKYLEGWTFIEGLYAWFATLSTIGYGDYIPFWKLLKNADHSATGIWIVISVISFPSLVTLSVVSGVLNSLVEAYDEFRIQFNACSRCRKKKFTKSKGKRKKEESFRGRPRRVASNVYGKRERSATV